MKTYVDNHGKICIEKPEIFQVGMDYFKDPIFNNDLIYHFGCISRFEQLDKNFEGYNKNYFGSSVKIYLWKVPELLTLLSNLINNDDSRIIKEVPNIDDIVILKSHNYKFKVLDNTAKLFIKVQSLNNPDWFPIFSLTELTK